MLVIAKPWETLGYGWEGAGPSSGKLKVAGKNETEFSCTFSHEYRG